MRERLLLLLSGMRQGFTKLSLIQKILFLGLSLVIMAALIVSIGFSTRDTYSYLFKKPLTTKDIGLISAELERLNISYSVLQDKYIIVEDEATGTRVRTMLAQSNLLPGDIKGWELFDMESWTTTEFDRNVKLRRAIEGEMKRHIESLTWVESVQISISVPEQSLYTQRASDVEAALTLIPNEGYLANLSDEKIIKGIENIVAHGIDGLSRNNIVITDASGRQLNLFPEESYELQIKQALQENKVKELETRKIKKSVEDLLLGILPRDRFRVVVDVELNFNKKTLEQKEILPVVVKERTPLLPYDDSIVLEKVEVSSKTLDEDFEGLGFIPEGPPGQEPNLPPGYKESLEGKNKYSKNERIDNYANGERIIKQTDDAMEIERKSVSVTVDGLWEKEFDENGLPVVIGNRLKRVYKEVSENDLQKFKDVVRGGVNYNPGRGDQVIVENIAFDRQAQFAEEDATYIRNFRIRRVILYISASLFIIILIVIFYRFAVNAIERRRQMRMEQEKLMSRLQRERALTEFEDAEAEALISEEELESQQLQQEITAMIQQNPKEIAKVVSTVIEEKS